MRRSFPALLLLPLLFLLLLTACSAEEGLVPRGVYESVEGRTIIVRKDRTLLLGGAMDMDYGAWIEEATGAPPPSGDSWDKPFVFTANEDGNRVYLSVQLTESLGLRLSYRPYDKVLRFMDEEYTYKGKSND